MKRRGHWLLAIAVLALDACGPGGTEGALGHGEFGYVCSTQADSACAQAFEGSAALPDAIAVGASFSLVYPPNRGTPTPSLESTTPSILEQSDGNFSFVRAGRAGVVAPAAGGIVDFTELTGKDIATLRLAQSSFSGSSCAPVPPPDLDGGTDGGA